MEVSDWLASIAIFISIISGCFTYKTYKESKRSNLINEIAILQKDYDNFVERYRNAFINAENNKDFSQRYLDECKNEAAEYQTKYLETEERLNTLRDKLK
ncbi:hypothetical protein UB33_11010 [Photobacterium angustum]|uniref:hypothetical protein n=1 Tax=Photobacterium angustum TaxID=661 RepID=UPI0005E6811E|nr:hypothetical protein [Photobacterium angustum]KJG05888.1 hypothetical protein UB33_11010 [Photobacterium angustum]PSV92620.1 hypothetical protein CTN01_12400 [Photobacterium angustum]